MRSVLVDLQAAFAAVGRGLVHFEVAPGVHAFADRRPMHRVRAYTTAQLGPFAERQVQEMHLIGHVHLREGKVLLVEGFNGGEGARWAEKAATHFTEAGLLDPEAEIRAETPLRGCPHAMR